MSANNDTQQTDRVPQDDFATRTGDLSKQWEGHAAFRDQTKNMYRTTYNDSINGREVAVNTSLPSGYGGHIPDYGHDVLYKRTAQEVENTLNEVFAQEV